jgi:hypothetical protein
LVPAFVCLCPVVGFAADAPDAQGAAARIHQQHGLDPTAPLESRVGKTSASVLKLFRDAGHTDTKAHPLSEAERGQLRAAIKALPRVHRRILHERLRLVSFLDGMPNTALTSTANPKESFELFDITFNARILRQNVSEWLTWKEQSCFDSKGSRFSVSVDAGTKLNALLYVLLHEATHIVDMSEGITPPIVLDGRSVKAASRPANAFTEGVWNDLSLPVAAFRDPIRERVRFYSNPDAGLIPVDQAPDVYEWLRRTPFVSLYGGRNWLDDLAEFATVYHLTRVLKQPYRIVIRRGNEEVFAYEPMKSELVRRRFGQMKRFYQSGQQTDERPAVGLDPRPVTKEKPRT